MYKRRIERARKDILKSFLYSEWHVFLSTWKYHWDFKKFLNHFCYVIFEIVRLHFLKEEKYIFNYSFSIEHPTNNPIFDRTKTNYNRISVQSIISSFTNDSLRGAVYRNAPHIQPDELHSAKGANGRNGARGRG